MTLQQYREEQSLSYKKLSELLSFTENKTYRICNDSELCIKLIDAHNIVKMTEGMVGYDDLLGEC